MERATFFGDDGQAFLHHVIPAGQCQVLKGGDRGADIDAQAALSSNLVRTPRGGTL